MYTRDENLNNLLKDKTIAYVGPAPNLVDTNSGEKIDSYDLVCRLQEFPVPESRYKDYGKRTDLLMSCCNGNVRKTIGPYFEKKHDFVKNLKYVVCPRYMLENDGTDLERAWRQINTTNVPFHIIGDEYISHIDKAVGCQTNTGLAGIITLLNYDMKEVYITGVTFYNMGKRDQLETFYYEEYAQYMENVGYNRQSDWPSHNDQASQIKYFAELIKQTDRIKLDEYLKKKFWLYDQKIL